MIIEHIFGTIKRKWGYGFTDLRGLKKVNGEFALIMTVLNVPSTSLEYLIYCRKSENGNLTTTKCFWLKIKLFLAFLEVYWAIEAYS